MNNLVISPSSAVHGGQYDIKKGSLALSYNRVVVCDGHEESRPRVLSAVRMRSYIDMISDRARL